MHQNRSRLVGGILLILLGAYFLAVQFVPGLDRWTELSWPLIVVGVGGLFLVAAFITRIYPFAIPGSIVAGIGGLLFYQNATGDWDSWAYAWTLIPGFVGIGIALTGVLAGRIRGSLSAGATLVVISLVLFAIFGSFLGGPAILRDYWPVLLIALGILMLTRSLIRSR